MDISNVKEYLVEANNRMSRDELLRQYWYSHPRFNFFKYAGKSGAKFLDIGAGNGGLCFWKKWETPNRYDLRLYGVDLERGENADRFEEFLALNLDEQVLPFSDESMDIVYSTHVLEHLHYPEKTIREMVRVLKPGGLCYIEQPNHNSIKVPSRDDFSEQGIYVSTTNFYDDKTHIRPYSANEVADIFLKNDEKFKVLQSGTILNEYLADHLLAYGRQKEDSELLLYGIWLKARWSDYVIVEKCVR